MLTLAVLRTGRGVSRSLADPVVAPKHTAYLVSACRRLLEAGQLRRLYVLLLFMNDLPRAALACIHLYAEQYVWRVRGALARTGLGLNLLRERERHGQVDRTERRATTTWRSRCTCSNRPRCARMDQPMRGRGCDLA